MIELILSGVWIQHDSDDIEAKLRIDQIMLADIIQRDSFHLSLLGGGTVL